MKQKILLFSLIAVIALSAGIISVDAHHPFWQDAPVNFHATEITDTTITLAWEQVPNSTVDHYTVQYLLKPEIIDDVFTTTDTSYTITGLLPNRTYDVYVNSHDEPNAEGSYVAHLTAKTMPHDGMMVHPPTITHPVIYAFTSTNNSATIHWYQALVNPATEYAVYWQKAQSGDTWERSAVPIGQTTQHTITSLDGGYQYHVKVIPVINGNDKLSPTYTYTGLSTVPNAVTNIQPSMIDYGQTIHVTWESTSSKHSIYYVKIWDQTHDTEFTTYVASATGTDIGTETLHDGDTVRLEVINQFSYHTSHAYHYITTLYLPPLSP